MGCKLSTHFSFSGEIKIALPIGRAGEAGDTGALGWGEGGDTTDTVTVRPRAGVTCGRVTRRADARAAGRVTFLARARAGRAALWLFFLGVARGGFLEIAPTQGVTASPIQSTQDIPIRRLTYEVVDAAGGAAGSGTGDGVTGAVGLTVFFFFGAAFLAVFLDAAFLVVFFAVFLGTARNKGVAHPSKVSSKAFMVNLQSGEPCGFQGHIAYALKQICDEIQCAIDF